MLTRSALCAACQSGRSLRAQSCRIGELTSRGSHRNSSISIDLGWQLRRSAALHIVVARESLSTAPNGKSKMSDVYDFGNLSPIEFEALVADLLGEELSITFETFSEGADGGIDARYACAKGDIIVQAKHYKGVCRQRFRDRWPPELGEGLAHAVGLIMRRICGEASAAFRWSFV